MPIRTVHPTRKAPAFARVPLDGSTSFAWPPIGHPECVWYTMTYADSRRLDTLCSDAYGEKHPTHLQRLQMIMERGWMVHEVDANRREVRSPYSMAQEVE